jgi:hypothetical protein
MSQVTLVPLLLWVAALACAGVAIWQGAQPTERSFVIDRLLRYLFLFPLGVLGLWAFLGHVFFRLSDANRRSRAAVLRERKEAAQVARYAGARS